MRLELLKRFMRIETRIVIIERNHHADGHAIFGQPVKPSSAVHAGIERPAERVRDVSCLDAPRRDFPKLLDADPIDLRIEAIELQTMDHVLRQ